MVDGNQVGRILEKKSLSNIILSEKLKIDSDVLHDVEGLVP